eukprot:GEMP01010217.1.p1 GENE.GEMP01010217.1~~GEMP01010217.1.p1  ORF type:complete len:761 (+),score=191.24 GEMP01010217.1:494-2776(+)
MSHSDDENTKAVAAQQALPAKEPPATSPSREISMEVSPDIAGKAAPHPSPEAPYVLDATPASTDAPVYSPSPDAPHMSTDAAITPLPDSAQQGAPGEKIPAPTMGAVVDAGNDGECANQQGGATTVPRDVKEEDGKKEDAGSGACVKTLLSLCYDKVTQKLTVCALLKHYYESTDEESTSVVQVSEFVSHCFAIALNWLEIGRASRGFSIFSTSGTSGRTSRLSIASWLPTPRMTPDSGQSLLAADSRVSLSMEKIAGRGKRDLPSKSVYAPQRSMSVGTVDTKGLQEKNEHDLKDHPQKNDTDEMASSRASPKGSTWEGKTRDPPSHASPRARHSHNVAPDFSTHSSHRNYIDENGTAACRSSFARDKRGSSEPPTGRHRLRVSTDKCEVRRKSDWITTGDKGEVPITTFTLQPSVAPTSSAREGNMAPACRTDSPIDKIKRSGTLPTAQFTSASTENCVLLQRQSDPTAITVGDKDGDPLATPTLPAFAPVSPVRASPAHEVESPRRARDSKKFGTRNKQVQKGQSCARAKKTEHSETRQEQAPQQPSGISHEKRRPFNDNCGRPVVSCGTEAAHLCGKEKDSKEVVSDATADCKQVDPPKNENIGNNSTTLRESVDARRYALHLRERICGRERPNERGKIGFALDDVEDAITLQQCYRLAVGRGPVVVPKQKLSDDTHILPTQTTDVCCGPGRRRHLEQHCGFCKLRPPGLRWKASRQPALILPRLAPPPPIPPCIQLRLTKPGATQQKATKDFGTR